MNDLYAPFKELKEIFDDSYAINKHEAYQLFVSMAMIPFLDLEDYMIFQGVDFEQLASLQLAMDDLNELSKCLKKPDYPDQFLKTRVDDYFTSINGAFYKMHGIQKFPLPDSLR